MHVLAMIVILSVKSEKREMNAKNEKLDERNAIFTWLMQGV